MYVKSIEWDDDTFHHREIKVLLLGSSRVLLEKGLSESLAGRFEEIRMTHWNYPEMKECFGFTLNQYLFYGAYPGAASLIDDEERFQQYIQSSIIDATINKDILMDTPIGKPALLSQAFAQRFEVFYWRERNDEVDFILRKKGSVVAIEVKSNAEKSTSGLNKFKEIFHPKTAFIVGDGGISVEEFLSMDLKKLF